MVTYLPPGMAEETEELEVSFRLDEEGRTVPSSPDFQPTGSGASLLYAARTEHTALRWVGVLEDDGKAGSAATIGSNSSIDYCGAALDELLLDAEISDCGLMPRTFWVPAAPFSTSEDANNNDKHRNDGGSRFVPRFSLEQLALDVFERHASEARGSFDPATSGAEWWVQIRPSPERTGRYSMHAANDGDNSGDEAEDTTEACVKKGGISFHWDKDEDLRLLTGGTTFVHPHLSTVT